MLHILNCPTLVKLFCILFVPSYYLLYSQSTPEVVFHNRECFLILQCIVIVHLFDQIFLFMVLALLILALMLKSNKALTVEANIDIAGNVSGAVLQDDRPP